MSGSVMTILMAEDDLDDRLLMEEAVVEAGLNLEIHFVGDGIELLARLRQAKSGGQEQGLPLPNLVLLDLNMPRMDGREVLERLKIDDDCQDIPVIVLTTSQSPEDHSLAKVLGAVDFLTKPTSFQGLVALARSLPEYCRQTANPGPVPDPDLDPDLDSDSVSLRNGGPEGRQDWRTLP